MNAAFPTFVKWSGGILAVVSAVVWMVTATILPPAIVPPAPLLLMFGTMFGGGLGTEAIRSVGKDA